MSSSKFPQSQYSKTAPDPQRVIKPILQSRKKPEKKPADFRPISTQGVKPKQSPPRKSEKAKKDQESTLLTYKEQRDLRCRNSDIGKTEKKTLNEIEKIQNTIRKTPTAHDMAELSSNNNKIFTSNSRTPSLSNQFLFTELYKADNFDSGSVKDRICRQFLQKFAEKKESIDNEKTEEEDKVNEDLQVSFEDTNSFMPEIPFFQYNYTNYEVLESDFSCFDINEKFDEPEPYPGTISLMYEIFLDTETANLTTTKTYEYTGVSLPSVEPVFFKHTGKITVNKNTTFVQENIERTKPEVRILKRFSLEGMKKPVCGLFFDQKPEELVRITDQFALVTEKKPVVSLIELKKFEKTGKILSFYQFEQFKAKVLSKPLIVIQENHKKQKSIPQSQVESQKILTLDLCTSPTLPSDRQIPLFDPQFSLSKHQSYETPYQPFSIDHVPQTPAFSYATCQNIPFLTILQVLISKFQISSEKSAQALKKRKQESALFVIFSLKKYLTLFNHFYSWKKKIRTLIRKVESEYIPDSKTIEKFLNFSACFIQRNWKGYFVRKFVVPSVIRYKQFKDKLKAVVIGWKTRRILATRRLQGHFKTIKDLQTIIFDMNKDPAGSSDSLLPRFIEELPKVHSKMIKDFNSLYRTGTWVALLKSGQKKISDTSKTLNFKSINRDEMPIKPLAINYNEVPSETDAVQPPPKRVFRNFLKRKSKTVNIQENYEKSVNATEESKEKYENTSRIREKFNNIDLVIQEQIEDIEEENMPEDRKFESKPKEFLKRKSQSIKPKKLQWNVKKKIDCWVSKEVYLKKPQKTVNTVQRDYFSIEELESIFEESLRNFVDTSSYLKKFERIAAKTRIPQFRNCSDFLFGVKEENYYEILEELESHYLHLCTQGIRL